MFHTRWEARVFGMVQSLPGDNIDAGRHSLERLDPVSGGEMVEMIGRAHRRSDVRQRTQTSVTGSETTESIRSDIDPGR